MELTVNTTRPYRIRIQRGCLNEVGAVAAGLFRPGAKAAIVSDSNVMPLYGDRVAASLEQAGFTTIRFVFPAGESAKRLSTIKQMVGCFAQNGITRTDFVVALGGGVTGDMAGFAAASFLRGIPFVQIPTSLLAQIDSSVGGKTGVDLEEGKNLVGAFWQPSAVLIDPDTLATLPPHFFADGMAEAIKYGCIKSLPLFERFEREHAADFLEDLIYACVDIKRAVVENDERDTGERMLLNFGHTLGHALEKLHHYEGLSHGEAVGIGMVLISQAGEQAGLTEPGTARRIAEVLRRYGLPVSDPAGLRDVADAALIDKKSAGSNIRLVLLSRLGESFLYPLPHAELYDFIAGGNRS